MTGQAPGSAAQCFVPTTHVLWGSQHAGSASPSSRVQMRAYRNEGVFFSSVIVLFWILKIFFLTMYESVCLYVGMGTSVQLPRSPKEYVPYPWELELDCWSSQKWVLGSELGASGGAADVSNHWAIDPAPRVTFKRHFFSEDTSQAYYFFW